MHTHAVLQNHRRVWHRSDHHMRKINIFADLLYQRPHSDAARPYWRPPRPSIGVSPTELVLRKQPFAAYIHRPWECAS